MSATSIKIIRYTLGLVLFLVAINAFAGGYYGMAGAKNVPLEWLTGSPFHSYFLPGLILFLAVGGSALFAAIAVFRNTPIARTASILPGCNLLLQLLVF